MTTFKKLIIFLFLSICLSSSWANKTHDDFLECLSHKIRNSNTISQVIHTPKNSSYSTIYNSFSHRNLRITSNFKPSIIFTPNDESQIQAAIHCSKKHGLQIRIRGGGVTPRAYTLDVAGTRRPLLVPKRTLILADSKRNTNLS
ncbi:hypothetical protein AABB24_024077, partial [Solanum stoloniferum]